MSTTALTSRQQQRTTVRELQGSLSDPRAIAERLQAAAEVCHLVSPAMAAQPPEGCAVVTSAVLVDPADTYPIPGGGKHGRGKRALDAIARAAGLSWNGPGEGRLDDGSDPRCYHYRAVGAFRDLTRQLQMVSAEKVIDLRDGSDQVKAMKPGQVAQARANIAELAQSKARNRAIRAAFSIRTAYEAKDLAKPFLVARLAFTGESQDPEVRAKFRDMTAAAMLGGTTALFGGGAAAPPPRAPKVPAEQAIQIGERMPPPPVGTTPAIDGMNSGAAADDDDDVLSQDEEPPTQPETSALVLPTTKDWGEGKAIGLTETPRLREWVDRLERNLAGADLNPKWRAQYTALLESIAAELRWRVAHGEPTGAQGGRTPY